MIADNINFAILPSLSIEEKSKLPVKSGIYFVISSEDEVIYVGRASDLKGRWKQHHRFSQVKAEYPGAKIAWLECSDPEILNSVEIALIKAWSPVLNNSSVVSTPSTPRSSVPNFANSEDIPSLCCRKEAIELFLSISSYRRAEITKSACVDKSVWSRWERGERSPSFKKMQEVAPSFGLNVGEFAFALELLQSKHSDQSQAA